MFLIYPLLTLLFLCLFSSQAVIGAGAAGLVTARELMREGHSVTAFEQGDRLGGIWVYTKDIESDDPVGLHPNRRRLHSSMYAGLRTNLPREVMGYSDFPFDTHFPGESVDPRRFCTHEEVLAYLEAFASYFDVKQLIRFNTTVTKVTPVLMENGHTYHDCTTDGGSTWPKWEVSSRTLDSYGNVTSSIEIFDAVVVCNGHYSEPRVPNFTGQDVFPGFQMHSHNYRRPEEFIGKRVVLVGAAFSGIDIAQEIIDAGAAAVYLSARSWDDAKTGEAPDGSTPKGELIESNGSSGKGSEASLVFRVKNVEALAADGSVTFEGGFTAENIDVVMYTTGYLYRFPFLEGTPAAPAIDNNRVSSVYKHVFPTRWAPTLAFIGLPWKVVPFPQFELQSRWVAKCLSKRISLPRVEHMESEVEEYYAWMEEESLPKRYTHRAAGELQTQYNLWLSNAIGEGDAGWAQWRQELYSATSVLRRANGLNFRDTPMEDFAGEALEKAAAEAAALRAGAKPNVVVA